MIMTYLLYGANVLSFGWLLIPIFFLLMQSGWMIGFFTAGCIMYGGRKVQKLVWVLGWIFAPFSGLFYALTVLPGWAYVIAKAIPMSYAIEGLRFYADKGIFPTYHLSISLLLNCFYMVLTLMFLVFMFHKSRVNGLARLESE